MRRRRIIRILDKYLFVEAFSLYLIGAFGFLAFLIINQLILEGDRLLNPNFPTKEILKLVFLNVPYFLTLTIPVAVLFATLMTMGRLAKDNEIDAFFTNGIHLSRLFLPYFILAIGNVLLNFYVNEALVPKANALAERVYEKYPYLREQGSPEADPTIVNLPGGAFFCSSYLDKSSGVVYYSLYDTLTSEIIMKSKRDKASKGSLNDDAKVKMPTAERTQDERDNDTKKETDQAKITDKEASSLSQEQHSESKSPKDKDKGNHSLEIPEMKNISTTVILPTGTEASPPPAPPTFGPKGRGIPGETKPSVPPHEITNTSPTSTDYEELSGPAINLATSGQVSEERLNVSKSYLYLTDEQGLVTERKEMPFMQINLGLPLKDLISTIRTPEQLSREELQRQTELKRQIGLNPAKDATDLYLKYSIPFASLFLALVGVPLSLRAPRDERLLGLIFIYILGTGYYLVYFISKLMGYNEILPPFLAAWMQNIVFFVIGILVFAFSRK